MNDKPILLGTIGAWLIMFFVCLTLVGCPVYNVWAQGKAGEAELKRAEQNRQVKIQEAIAIEQSAEHLKQASITQAQGVKASNQIIDSSLTERYIHYLWVQSLEDDNTAVIYVPTEAGIPVTEAGRGTKK